MIVGTYVARARLDDRSLDFVSQRISQSLKFENPIALVVCCLISSLRQHVIQNSEEKSPLQTYLAWIRINIQIDNHKVRGYENPFLVESTILWKSSTTKSHGGGFPLHRIF